MRPLRFTPWPTARRDEFLRRCRAGQRPAQIAKALGVSRAVVYEHARRIPHSFGWDGGKGMPAPPPAPDVRPLAEEAATDPAATGVQPLHLAAYLANVELGCTVRPVARLIGRDPKLVRWAVRRIEDRREDPEFDAFMERLGDRAREMVA
jgi:hypothetical protein